MEIKGRITDILQVQTGEGRNGTWRKQDFVLETEAKFPKKVCITIWGDKIDQFGLAVDQNVVASIDIESREFNGKWYTNVQAWKVVKEEAMASGGGEAAAPFPTEEPSFAAEGEGEDDLPF